MAGSKNKMKREIRENIRENQRENQMENQKKHKRENKGWNLAALFMMVLIISLPVYSSNVLAVSVEITKNSGEDGIDRYVDGKGDVWNLEATVRNVPDESSISAEQMDIILGGNTDTFDACSQSADGFICKYQSDLSSGAVEDRYNLQAIYRPTGEGDPGSIIVDSTAPDITERLAVSQNNEGKIRMSFEVEDKPDFGVGLGKIEIVDVETGQVLQAISNFSDSNNGRTIKYNYLEDGEFWGILQAPADYLAGAEEKRLQLRVEDRFGHRKTGLPVKLAMDFVKPSIVTGSLNFTDLDGFIGPSSVVTKMTIDIQENNELLEVSAFSDRISIPNDNVADSCTVIGENLQRCTWHDVRVESVDALSVKVTAKDAFQNTVEGDLAFTFARDVQAPRVEFFGTERVFADESYLSAEEENKIVMRINEVGAGLVKEGVLVNFNNLGCSGIGEKSPDSCERNGSYVCIWENIDVCDVGSDRDVEFKVIRLRDLVGNEGDHLDYHMLVDSTPPKINRLEIIAVNDFGEKDHFQAEDKILVRMNLSEPSGIFFRIDLNDVVMGADSLYPAGDFNEAGWQLFTEDSCVRNGLDWTCEFLTSRGLRSEYQGNAVIELELEDTSGNKLRETQWPDVFRNKVIRSSNNRFFFQKLALDEDQHPDYWTIAPSSVKPKVPFIDMETTEFVSTRMAFDVQMKASPSVSALRVELVNCESNFPDVGRQVLWNNIYAEPDISPTTFNLVLEFLPFNAREYFADQLVGENFKTAPIDFDCTFNIYSKVGRKAIRAAETETVKVSVPFGFSALGSEDEALEQLIAREKEAIQTGWWGALGTINGFLKTLKYIAGIGTLALGIINVLDIFGGLISDGKVAAYSVNPTSAVPWQLQEISYCMGITSIDQTIGETALTYTNQILGFFTCSTTPCGDGALWDSSFGDNWFETVSCIPVWTYNSMAKIEQEVVHGTVEFEEGTFIPSTVSPYENIYLSIASFCIPGILHNLDKMRQIECRYIDCLETEVAQGLATVQACGKLRDVLQCKYVFGPLFQLIPFVGAFWGDFLDALGSLLTDPVAWVTTGAIVYCAYDCMNAYPYHPAMGVPCRWIHFGIKVLGIIDQTWGTIKSIEQELAGGADYCSRVLDDDEQEPTTEVSENDTVLGGDG